MPAISLTTRLVILLTACISVTLLVTTTVDYQISKRRILNEVSARTESTVAAAVNDLEVRLVSIEASTELLAEVIALGDYSQEQLRELLREAVDERNDLFGAALALKPRWSERPSVGFAPYYYYRDEEIAYSDLATAYDYVLSAWFREPASAGRPVWTEPYFDEGGGNVLMSTFSVPIYRTIDGEEQLYGVVTADITLDELQYYLDRMELGPSGFGFLLSRDGRLMAAPERDNLLRPLLQVLPKSPDLERWAGMLTDVTEGSKASIVVNCRDGSGRCIVKLAPLSSTGWPVGAFYSEDEMLAPLRVYLAKSALSQGVTLILLVLGVIWVSRRITRPLRALARASLEVATGNFHTELPKTENRDELGRLVQAFSLMQDDLQRYVAELKAETAKRNRLEGELSAATAIQMAMVPGSGRSHLEEQRFTLWAALRPARSVGGDLYTHLLEPSGRLFTAVGDVSDKGVPAALFMARATTLLQQYAGADLPPDAILAHLNNQLVEGNENYMFVTLFVGWLDLDSLELTFASGGHTPPSLLRDLTCRSIAQEAGPALGLQEELEFPLNQIQLQPGDLLAIFTDGVDEAFDAGARAFGIDGFNRLLEKNRGESLDAVGETAFAVLDQHAGDTPQSDDITIMLLQLPPIGGRDRLELRPDDGALATLLAWLQGRLNALSVDSDRGRELLLVAEEAVTNIVKYGRLEYDQRILAMLQCEDDQLILELRDPGVPFNPLADADRSELGRDTESAPIGGLGVHLLEAFTDRQEYSRTETGNCLRLIKRL